MATDSYLVTFTAYVDETRRPENFPHEVHIKEVFDAESVPHLQYLVNKKFVDLVTSAGLVVLRNEDEPIEEGKITFDRRIFVAWHLLTYMTLDVKHIDKPQRPQDAIIPPSNLPPSPGKEMVN